VFIIIRYLYHFYYRPLKRKRVARPNVRKRARNEGDWKKNVRKRKHQAGESYLSVRGKIVGEKKVCNLKNCLNNCKFQCSNFISNDLRAQIHKKFYELSQNEKYHFISNTTERRLKKQKLSISDRKNFSFLYFLQNENVLLRVCKPFYLGTLNISQKVIYGVHQRKDVVTGVPSSDKRGRHGKHNKVTEERKNFVRNHIKSFPVVESHYCRSDTKRKYSYIAHPCRLTTCTICIRTLVPTTVNSW
jgi:hypothetical protein